MTPIDPSTPSAPGSNSLSEADFIELVKSVRSLRVLFNLALAILLLFLVTLNAFMLWQIRATRIQASRLTPAVREMERVVGEYETNSVPIMQQFTVELRRFAERNPDFAPILNRYAGAVPSGRPTNAPPQAPVANPAPNK